MENSGQNILNNSTNEKQSKEKPILLSQIITNELPPSNNNKKIPKAYVWFPFLWFVSNYSKSISNIFYFVEFLESSCYDIDTLQRSDKNG